MTLKENPFYILGVSPRDNKRKIMEAAEEKLLFMDADIVEKAKNDLLDSNRRLDAELGWILFDIDNDFNKQLIEALNSNLFDGRLISNIYCLDEVNFELEILRHRLDFFKNFSKELSTKVFVISILDIADNFYGYEGTNEYCSDIEDLESLINDYRKETSFPEINTEDLIEHLDARREDIVSQLKSIMNELPTDCLINAMTSIAEKSTEKASERAPMMIESLLEIYNVEIQSFIDNQRDKIEKIYEVLNQISNQGTAQYFEEKNLQIWLDELIVYVSVWNYVVKPIQILFLSKGKEHNESQDIFSGLRNICLITNNKFGMPKLSLKVIQKLNDEDFCRYMPSFDKLFKDDIKILTDMVKKQEEYERQEAEERKEYEEWAESIYYETEFGIIFKDKFKISVEGIEYNGRTTPLNNIIGISWGGITNYWNCVPTGTDYTIRYKTTDKEIAINPEENQFKRITECLWKAVGLTIFTNMLKRLENGKTLKVGNIKIKDTGAYLVKSGWFSSDEAFFPWSKITIYSQDGLLYLQEKDGKHKASASYMSDMNTHILDFMIRLFFKKFDSSNPKISILLHK